MEIPHLCKIQILLSGTAAITDNTQEYFREFIRSPAAIALAVPVALALIAPPSLPTFVPLGSPLPNAGLGGMVNVNGEGILPRVALMVRYSLQLEQEPMNFLQPESYQIIFIFMVLECGCAGRGVSFDHWLARSGGNLCFQYSFGKWLWIPCFQNLTGYSCIVQ